MPDKIRVLIQMRHTTEISAAAATRSGAPRAMPGMGMAGVSMDDGFSPVKIPRRERRATVSAREVGRVFGFDARPESSTYVVRGEVEDEAALNELIAAVDRDADGIGVFSDARVAGFAVCPPGPVGTHQDVENRLNVAALLNRGMDGANVPVAIVDTGVNLDHLQAHGKQPAFDAGRSWSPVAGSHLGNMPVDHGTMCAFDVCIAAPNCTLYDYALLQSQAQGGSVMDGFLSDAVAGFGQLLDLMTGPDAPGALVVNNSWGMFHPSWDFPVGQPGNYSDDPDHPFNIIVESLEDAGADILFAAGNCGQECADDRCQGATDEGIFGANSSSSVLCIAGVTVDRVRLGYSTQGPGRLDQNKPDVAAYTHFRGSEVYAPRPDGGTSAACPVAAGVVAAIRSRYSSAELSPAQLRNLIRRSADDLGLQGFDFDHGFGAIDVDALLASLERRDTQPLAIGQSVSGSLSETGQTLTYLVRVGDTLNVSLDGPQGVDFDVYVKRDMEPTTEDYDFRGYTNSASEKIRIESAKPGDYYVMVRSYRGAGSFTLQATLD